MTPRFPDFAEFIIGPAHRVRPLAGPMAGSGRTRWLNPCCRTTGFVKPTGYRLGETIGFVKPTGYRPK